MTTITKPAITKKWWKDEKPADIKGADLEKALASAEKSLADAKKSKDGKALKVAIEELTKLGDAIEKTQKKELDKNKHKDLIEALDDLNKLADDEKEELEGSQESDEAK